jgi:uncharacterized membrane protein YkoI
VKGVTILTQYRNITAALVVGMAMSSVSVAADKKITRAQLPAAVERTVAQQSRGAVIKGFSTEQEASKTVYEMELTVNGHGKDISMDAHGNVLEIEEEVALASVPADVQAGLTKAAGTGKIVKIESLTKQGKLVAYEADVQSGKKRREIQVGPQGQKLAHPE